MEQLAGNENRPRQLGDTGIIVLTKCEMGDCECNDKDSKKSTNKTTEKSRNRRPLISKVRDVPDRTPIITRYLVNICISTYLHTKATPLKPKDNCFLH